MNRRFSYLAIAIVVVFTVPCPPAFAKKDKAGTEMTLVSVDIPNNKITVSDPSNKDITTLTVMQVTKVTIDHQPAKLSDLKHGMRVNLSVSQGGKVADKIDATGPAPKNTN
jgi:hypothetical protein